MCITNETKAFYSNINTFVLKFSPVNFIFYLHTNYVCIIMYPPNKRSKSMKSICQQKVSTQSIKL